VTGDSITKQWREVQPQVNGTPEVFTTYFGQYAAAILGVGGAPCFIDAAWIVKAVLQDWHAMSHVQSGFLLMVNSFAGALCLGRHESRLGIVLATLSSKLQPVFA